MFEAHLDEGKTLKDIVDSIKDLVQDCNLDCTEEDISIQAMDSAHCSLVSVRLASTAFSHYRCDKPNSLGVNTMNLSKIFKMMGKDDGVTVKAEEGGDTLTLMFEGTKTDTIADFGACDDAAEYSVVAHIRPLTFSFFFCRTQVDGD